MRDELQRALAGHEADYIEIRVEDSEGTKLSYRGRELEDISHSSGLGGCVRAAYKGGWGFVSFNDLSDLRGRVELAVRQARLVGAEKTELAPIAPVVDVVPPRQVGRDPLSVPLADKKSLMDEYNEIVWSLPKIQTSRAFYGDGRKKVIFANSQGTYIEQTKVDLSARLTVITRAGDLVQQASISMGSNADYVPFQSLHQQIKDTAERAIMLLDAKPVKGGEYTVVCDPILSGVFAHEAFGHLSESDHIYENAHLQELMVLGKRFGPDILNIVDGAAVPGLRGSYAYDEEGCPASKTYLIKDGILVGRLHSRETAGKMGEKPTGNARAINYRHEPIVRMTNTYIEPGSLSFDDLIADIKEGIYARSYYGGTTSMEMFTFTAEEGWMIRNGKLAEPVRSVMLTGNVFSTLFNIDAIGNDLGFNQGGGCGKGGQFPLPVTTGGPHIRIQRCVVGGGSL
ncbi:MAG: TldD/PmbA family protein [Chloroflexota bacterium]|nr:MAG: TldD/PmbA family protein [Chloroflexota bacterium]